MNFNKNIFACLLSLLGNWPGGGEHFSKIVFLDYSMKGNISRKRLRSESFRVQVKKNNRTQPKILTDIQASPNV